MKNIRLLILLTVALLLLSACSTAPQEPATVPTTAAPTTEPTVPETTPPPSIETTDPSIDASDTTEYALSFFTYETTPILAYFNFYIAPAGTANWYPVYLDVFDESNGCDHQRNPDVKVEDLVHLRRALVAYDGPENTQWILRAEYHPTEESLSFFGGSGEPYYYQWDTVFELANNETILYLPSRPDYVQTEGNTLGDSIVPMTKPMEFCENCPESWREPVPIETILPEATTAPPETTEPVVEVTIPEGYPISFFMYFSAPVQAYCNFYIAPAGTEDWYPVLIDQAQIWHTHPRIPNGNPDDDVVITRAYIAYDGSDISQWILRLEYPIDANGPTFNSIPKPYEYQWKTEFELENNHTLLHLELVPNYLTLPDDTEIGEYYVPTTRPMEFCENCPESWREPVK